MGQSPVDDQTYNLLQVLTSKLEACAVNTVSSTSAKFCMR